MIKIRVKGPLSTVTGEKLAIRKKICDIQGLMVYLNEKFLKSAEEKGLSSILRNFFSHNIIIVNGVEISALNGPRTTIKDGDEIVILNITHGG